MNRDVSMEQEFEKIKLEHKRQTIMTVLIKFFDEGIYNHKYFKKYKNMEVTFIEGHEQEFNFIQTKAFRVEEDIEERTANGEDDLFDKVYEMCWKKLRDVISEDKTFHG